MALGAWLWAEIESSKNEAHPQDIALFKKAEKLINPELYTLRTQNFGDTFSAKFGKGLFDIRETWSGPAYKFQDQIVGQAWEDTRTAIDDFLDNLVQACGPHPQNPSVFTVKTGEDIRLGDRSERTIANAELLNEQASRLTQKWDETVQRAIKRLGIAAQEET